MVVESPGPQERPLRVKLRQHIHIGFLPAVQRCIANRQRIDYPVINRALAPERVHIPALVKTNASRTRHVTARKEAVNRSQITTQRTE